MLLSVEQIKFTGKLENVIAYQKKVWSNFYLQKCTFLKLEQRVQDVKNKVDEVQKNLGVLHTQVP